MKNVLFLPLILFVISVKGQERIDEVQPKIVSAIKTINQFTGWMKNDLGKWVSANKAIPNYNHNSTGVLRFCEQLIKIEWCRIQYDGKSYLCFSKFGIYQFEKWNRVNTENVCEFWLVADTTLSNDIFTTTSETNHILLNTVANGSMDLFTPITWKQILIELKKVLKERNSDTDNIKELENLDFQYRLSKSQNIQFTIGNSSGRCDVGDLELTNSYYETTLSSMKSFLTTIIL